MKLSGPIILATLVCALSACTSSTPASKAEAETVAAAESGKRCKTIIRTGTRLRSKICKTNEEWEQEARSSREAIESIQRTSTHGPGPSGG